MKRLENESFADYKIRRAADNKAAKAINRAANAGGSKTSRQILRDSLRKNGKLKGVFGRNLMASFAEKNLAAMQRKQEKRAERNQLRLAA